MRAARLDPCSLLSSEVPPNPQTIEGSEHPTRKRQRMSRITMGGAAIAVALLLSGCGASQAAYNPFKVPPEQWRPKVKTVALAPMYASQGLENPTPATEKFQTMIMTELRGAGWTIIEPAQVKVIWDSMVAAQVDGFYDPKTGQRDEAKLKAVRMNTYRELKGRFNIDALLFSYLAIVGAKLDHDQAKWDGVTQGAGKKTFLKALVGISHYGTVPALTLQVNLSDAEDTALYENAGGIQVMAKIGPNSQADPVPRDELFVDEERNVRAVHLALDPMLGRVIKN